MRILLSPLTLLDSSSIVVLVLVLASIIGTPGPNNTLLLLCGLQQGFKKAIPLLIAINLGAISMVAVSLSATHLIKEFIVSFAEYLNLLSALLLFYLGYALWPKAKTENKQANFFEENSPQNQSKFIINPIQLYFFQFINPKIWMASLSVIASFQEKLSVFTILIIMSIIGFALNTLWVISGIFVKQMTLNLSHQTISKIGAITLFLCVPYFLFM